MSYGVNNTFGYDGFNLCCTFQNFVLKYPCFISSSSNFMQVLVPAHSVLYLVLYSKRHLVATILTVSGRRTVSNFPSQIYHLSASSSHSDSPSSRYYLFSHTPSSSRNHRSNVHLITFWSQVQPLVTLAQTLAAFACHIHSGTQLSSSAVAVDIRTSSLVQS
jgi:hypothetical protein